MKQIGTRVTVLGGMAEFVGKTGEIVDSEKLAGQPRAYRVRLDDPINIPGVGLVSDDLWEGQHLKTIRPRKVAPPKLVGRQLAVMAAIMGLSNAGQDHLFLGNDPQVTPEDAAREVVVCLGGCDPLESAVTAFGGGLFETEEMADMFFDEAKAWVKKLRPMSIDKIKSIWRYGAFVDAICQPGASVMRRTNIYSIFGQIDAVIAESMASEGKVRRIETNMIPSTALFNDQGQQAKFAIVMSDEYLDEYTTRVANLRA